MNSLLTSQDISWLAGRGIAEAEARRQITLLQSGTQPFRPLRPARLDDGILAPAAEQCEDWARDGAFLGKCGGLGFFVPASGAASRMFESMRQFLAGSHPEQEEEGCRLKKLASTVPVRQELSKAGLSPEEASPREIARVLMNAGWPERPKAFLPFHARSPKSREARTAFEEQCRETARLLQGGPGCLHITLPESSMSLVPELAAKAREIGEAHGSRIELQASIQSPATDTLSLQEDGTLARTEDGTPLLRAGGHGSLLGNLESTPGEVVLVKNIDNIQPAWREELILPWRLALAGLCHRIRRTADLLLAGGDPALLADLLQPWNFPLPQTDKAWRELADRPIRVVGVVPNSGDAGGGPFRAPDGSLQIVEQSELPPSDRTRWMSESTHFNPVDMACAFRHSNGTAGPLVRFRDPARAFTSTKTHQARSLRILEHPGLWNGSMSHWLTLCVEIPAACFLPAKTIHDLAHPWRQTPG